MSPFEIEAKAALAAVRRCSGELHSARIVLEGDCMELTKALTRGVHVEDIGVFKMIKQ